MARTIRLFCLLLAGIGLLPAIVASAGIAVKPANITLDLGKGRPSGRFVISNTGTTEKRYRVQAAHFDYSADGQLRLLPPDRQSLAPWVKFNPKEFTLPPNGKRAVRFVILPRASLADGEYWGAMELESLNTGRATSTDKEGHKVNLKIIPSVLVPIYGRLGTVRKNGVLQDLALERVQDVATLSVTVANTGQGRLFVRGEYRILDDAKREIASGPLPRGLVLPGRERRFRSLLEQPLADGQYTVRIDYHARDLERSALSHEQSIWLH